MNLQTRLARLERSPQLIERQKAILRLHARLTALYADVVTIQQREPETWTPTEQDTVHRWGQIDAIFNKARQRRAQGIRP